MSDSNLKIELKMNTDKNGKQYFIGKLKGPFSIDAKDGLAFLVFISNPGSEMLHISPLTQKKHDNKQLEVYNKNDYYNKNE